MPSPEPSACLGLGKTTTGTLWLGCYHASPGHDFGDGVIELTPDTPWQAVQRAVREHRCPATPVGVDTLTDEQAITAAMAVFGQAMNGAAPPWDVVTEAFAAAGDVYALAEDRSVDEVLAGTGLFDMNVLPGGDVRIRLKHSVELAASFVAAFDELVKQAPCDNYWAWDYTITDPATERARDAGLPDDQVPPLRKYKFIVVRPGKQDPDQLRRDADRRAQQLQEQLDAAYERLAIDEFDQDSCADLTTTIDYAIHHYRMVADAEGKAADEIDRLRAENRRMRTALTAVTENHATGDHEDAAAIAARALQGAGGPEAPYGDALDSRRPDGVRRQWTPDEKLPTGGTRVYVKRACNRCGTLIGDVTDAEIERGVAGRTLDDVAAECPRCTPEPK